MDNGRHGRAKAQRPTGATGRDNSRPGRAAEKDEEKRQGQTRQTEEPDRAGTAVNLQSESSSKSDLRNRKKKEKWQRGRLRDPHGESPSKSDQRNRKKGRKKKESRAELRRLGRGQQRDQSDDTLCAVRNWGVQDWQKSKGRIQTGAVEQATSPGQGKLCVKHKGRSSVQVEGWWWTENPSVLLAARKCMSCMSEACTAEP